MKKNIGYLLFTLGLVLLASGCEYDNFEEPGSLLKGNVVYNGEPIGVRTNAAQMELWQGGYALERNIPIYIDQDGSYSVALFDGQYKLVRKEGGPWQAELNDTLIIDVRGQTEFDIPVTPFFTIESGDIQESENSLTAEFSVDQIVESANIESVRLYLGTSLLTDQNRNEFSQTLDLTGLDLNQQNSFSVEIPENLRDKEYLFFRMGVRSTLSNEFYYTQVEKIIL